jgi:hypothetical protein
MAIRAGGQGDISQTHVVWRVANRGSYVPSLVFYQGLLPCGVSTINSVL